MYRKILVPIDPGDPTSWTRSLPRAAELLETSAGTIVALTVITDSHGLLDSPRLPSSYEALHAQMQRTLERMVAEHVPDGVAVETIIGHGSVHREIVRVAHEQEADLIVMSSHRPGVREYLLGPIAAHVARHAHCSILIVRE